MKAPVNQPDVIEALAQRIIEAARQRRRCPKRPPRPAPQPGKPALKLCERDILRTLREEGEPLSPAVLLAEMACKGWARHYVEGFLSRMVQDGILAGHDAYRLTPKGLALVSAPCRPLA